MTGDDEAEASKPRKASGLWLSRDRGGASSHALGSLNESERSSYQYSFGSPFGCSCAAETIGGRGGHHEEDETRANAARKAHTLKL
eukprot:COSAG04_NODE_9177_length_891_cov_0.541667_3_plen_85_part_01